MQLEKELMDHTCVLNFNAGYFSPLFAHINHISAVMIDGCQRRAIRLMDLRGLVWFQKETSTINTRGAHECGRMELAGHSSFYVPRRWISEVKYSSSSPAIFWPLLPHQELCFECFAAVKCDISLGWLRNCVPDSLSDSLNWAISWCFVSRASS